MTTDLYIVVYAERAQDTQDVPPRRACALLCEYADGSNSLLEMHGQGPPDKYQFAEMRDWSLAQNYHLAAEILVTVLDGSITREDILVTVFNDKVREALASYDQIEAQTWAVEALGQFVRRGYLIQSEAANASNQLLSVLARGVEVVQLEPIDEAAE